MGFPGGSDGKESTCHAGDPSSIPGLGRSPGEGNGYPRKYSCLENSLDRGAWRATVYGVATSQTQPKRPTLHLECPFSLGFPGSSVSKESSCSAGDQGLIPGSGRFPGEGTGNPLQYPCLENVMDRRAWQAAVHGVTKSWA